MKCESKNCLYIYNINLIEENNRFIKRKKNNNFQTNFCDKIKFYLPKSSLEIKSYSCPKKM